MVTTLLTGAGFANAAGMDQSATGMKQGGMQMNHAGMGDVGMAAPEQMACATLGALKLSGGYIRAMLPGQPVGGGFVTIANGGTTQDRLMSLSSPAAGRVELHEMVMQGTIMKMRRVPDGFTIAAGETLEMKPGGFHLMFMAVRKPFKPGDTVQVTLTFEKAGTIDMILPVTSMRGN